MAKARFATLPHSFVVTNENQWKNALADATVSESPSKLRELFAIIIVFCQPSEPQSLWEQCRNDFCEDILHTERTRLNDLQFTFSDEIFNRGLIEIDDFFMHVTWGASKRGGKNYLLPHVISINICIIVNSISEVNIIIRT